MGLEGLSMWFWWDYMAISHAAHQGEGLVWAENERVEMLSGG